MIKSKLKELVKKEGNSKNFFYKGYKCKIVRLNVENSGHLCGYIEIPKIHILHGMDYQKIEEKYNYKLPAHGGLTFSGPYNGNDYWIGFDCAHLGDLLPCYNKSFAISDFPNGVYRDMKYVQNSIKETIDYIENNTIE